MSSTSTRMSMKEINAALEAMTRFARIWLRQSAKDGSVSATDVISCKALLPIWETGINVTVGEYITYNGDVYKAKTEHVSTENPALDTTNWEPVTENADPDFNAKIAVDSLKSQQAATDSAVLGLMNMMLGV